MILTVTMVPAIDLVYEVEGDFAQRAATCAVVPAHGRRWFDAGKGINVARGVRDFARLVCALSLGGGVSGQLLAELLRTEGLVGEVVDASFEIRVNTTINGGSEELHVVETSPVPTASDLAALRSRVTNHADVCKVLVTDRGLIAVENCDPPLWACIALVRRPC